MTQTKKNARTSRAFFLVQQVEKCFHEIRDELERWRQILAVPYQEYLVSQSLSSGSQELH